MGDLMELKASLLCFEAKRWIGILEEGENSGQLIQIFQRSVDGQANKEPWCMAFAQYCIKMADKIFVELFPQKPLLESSIFRSEHCMTTWPIPGIRAHSCRSLSPLRGLYVFGKNTIAISQRPAVIQAL